MTTSDALKWSSTIGKKNYALMSVEKIRELIARQAGKKIYSEVGFTSQLYNVKGGLVDGSNWAHCWNGDQLDMVFIGNKRPRNSDLVKIYPGMLKSKFD